jgi:hypothetical protein
MLPALDYGLLDYGLLDCRARGAQSALSTPLVTIPGAEDHSRVES